MDPEVAGSSPVGRPHCETMTLFDAIILGIVQGLTEFLPVSSSGHLKLAQYFLGLEHLDKYVIFDLVCHLGTLAAILLVFSKSILSLFGKRTTLLWQVGVGTLPLFPLVMLVKPIKAAYADPSYLGFFFLLTSLVLFLGCRFGKTLPQDQVQQNQWKDAFRIGLFQAAAILPGVSRSGSTISGARLLGWNPHEAVVFSFLLAIPAIGGATLFELFKLFEHPENAIPLSPSHYIFGFFVSFIVGLAALQLLKRLAFQNKFHYFSWYCLLLGLATTCYFHLYS